MVIKAKGSIPALYGRLSQTGDVVGQCLDFAIIELGRDLRHLQIVFTNAVAKVSQLCGSVFSMLT